MSQYQIFIGVKDEDMVDNVIENIKDDPNINIVIGNTMKSFSQLVNTCLRQCDSDIMIFCSHKVRPLKLDIERICKLINEGYGYVGLYLFGCFGIHKDVIDKIGYFDENFISGGYEDDDFRIRLIMADIASYEDLSVKYIKSESLWDGERAEKYFKIKYDIDHNRKRIYCTIPNNINEYPNLTKKFYSKKKSIYVQNITTFFSYHILENYTIIPW